MAAKRIFIIMFIVFCLPNFFSVSSVACFSLSSFLDAIKESNDLKKSEWLSQGQDLEKRLKPSDMEN